MITAFKYVLSASLLCSAAVACTVGGPDEPSKKSSSSSSSSGSSTTQQQNPTETTSSSSGSTTSSSSGSSTQKPSKPTGATNVACKVADDCGYWFCDCKDSSGRVTPVNGRDCNNGWCMDAATSCPDACSAFGKTWTGTAGGGPDQ